MKRSMILLSLAVALVAGARATAEDGPKVTVSVAGVRSVAASAQKHELYAFGGSMEGVTLALLVKAEGCQVLGIEDGSRVKEFQDDTGADLFVGTGDMRSTRFGAFPQVSKDASALMIEIETPKAATKGAKTVHVEGKLAVRTANGTETKKATVVFEQGKSLDGSPIPIEIEKIADSGWEEYPVQVTFKSSKPLDTIAGWKLQDESGAEIKLTLGGQSSWNDGSGVVYQLYMNIAKKPAKGTVVLEVRKDLKTITVPVKVDAGLGL